jgi:subtilisin family serine protease
MKYGVVVFAALAAITVPVAAVAQSQYVVEASSWGPEQDRAVADAGGVVLFSHRGAGVAVVQSRAADFVKRVSRSRAIARAARDLEVRWQEPTVGGILEGQFTNPANNDLFFNTLQWAPQAIDAPAAWALGCTGEGVRVAVLDGGIQDTHPDLAPNLDVARSRSFVPNQAFNTDVGTFWHGTHVAGIVAAVDNTNNVNTGVIGVAPRATIIGVKVLHNGTGSFGGVIQGILYAATPIAQGGAGADIINMSLGATFARNDPENRGSGVLLGALNKAVNFAGSQGVLVVTAAGNEETDLDHSGSVISVPAQSGSGIAVAATGPVGFALGEDNFDRPASYTNFGVSAINVSAPGGDFALPGEAPCTIPTAAGPVTQPCWVFDMVLSTNRNGWAWAAGTSMAAPAVSAVAAMIKQQHPDISLGALKTTLQNSALRRDPKAFHGKGWVNALAACQQ